MKAKLEERSFKSFDGTRIVYYVTGPEDGPVLLISAGLGGGVEAWQGVVERFMSVMRVYLWDYRGLFSSGPAPDRTSYDVEHHARDLAALIEHESIRSPVLMGWSMGVQVNFEFLRQQPEAASALVALHGAYRYPLSTAFNSTVPQRISPALFHVMRRHWRRWAPLMIRAAASPRLTKGFMRACRRAGMMAAACDMDMFYAMARDWVHLDLGIYAEIFERLGRHNAEDVLATVTAPTLVVAGGKDLFTPAHLSEAIVERISGAEIFMLPEATHFGPLEYPQAIGDRLENFLGQHIGLKLGS